MQEITNDEFELLTKYIKLHSGINLKSEKRMLVVSRLGGLLTELGFKNFMEYYKYLQEDTSMEALSELLDKITTNHTFFMREAEHFDIFRKEILPELKNTTKNNEIRLWCAASSTGEEPYTLAMILADFFSGSELYWDKRMLATDISSKVLNIAMNGVYSKDQILKLPKTWLHSYFQVRSDGFYEVKPKLKKEVVYRRFNLLEKQYPFKKPFHVIFCRNVLIYFDQVTKNDVIRKMRDSLEVGGYLFIGHSESIERSESGFEFVRPSVYRKI